MGIMGICPQLLLVDALTPNTLLIHTINIFGLKMMVKSGIEKMIMKSLHAQRLFQKLYFTS